MLNLLTTMVNLVKPVVNRNVAEFKQVPKNCIPTQKQKVTFRVDDFMFRNIVELIENTDLSISIFIKAALYDYISFYKEIGIEPFEMEHWLNNETLDLSAGRFTIVLDGTLFNEFDRLKRVYLGKGLQFNKSHFIRCAIINRLHNIILDNYE